VHTRGRYSRRETVASNIILPILRHVLGFTGNDKYSSGHTIVRIFNMVDYTNTCFLQQNVGFAEMQFDLHLDILE
jgi:hypothetical protein